MPVGPSQGASHRSPEQVAIDAEAARLRGLRYTHREIAAEMKCSVKTAQDRIARAYRDTLSEPAELARQFERERLDGLWRRAEEIANTVHYVTAHGKIVVDPDTGEKIVDDGPKLAAISSMRAIAESYRKLDGLDAPTRVEQSGSVKYEVVGFDTSALS